VRPSRRAPAGPQSSRDVGLPDACRPLCPSIPLPNHPSHACALSAGAPCEAPADGGPRLARARADCAAPPCRPRQVLRAVGPGRDCIKRTHALVACSNAQSSRCGRSWVGCRLPHFPAGRLPSARPPASARPPLPRLPPSFAAADGAEAWARGRAPGGQSQSEPGLPPSEVRSPYDPRQPSELSRKADNTIRQANRLNGHRSRPSASVPGSDGGIAEVAPDTAAGGPIGAGFGRAPYPQRRRSPPRTRWSE
jgi:hypothetical protein